MSASDNVQVRLNSPVSVTATFSEPVSGFTVADISVVNGTANGFSGSDGNLVYTFDVTPDSLGKVTVDIAAGVATNGEGNPNTAAPRLSLGIPYDFDGNGGISRDEAIAAIRDYFSDRITRAQTIAVIVLYFSGPTEPEPEPEPMVMQSFTPGEELMVEHPAGAMIEIPADATGEENAGQLTVSIAEVDPPRESIFTDGPVFDFTIVDQEGNEVDLREPVILHLPYPEGLDPADIAVLHWNEALGRWDAEDVVDFDEQNSTVAVEVDHLSFADTEPYYDPMSLIAKGVLSLVGQGLKTHYDAGYKHLVSLHVTGGFSPPFLPFVEVGELGLALVLDVDDLASLPAVGLAPITVEGSDGYVTFWLNGSAALSLSAGAESPVGITFTVPNTGTDPCCRDPRFEASISAMTVSFPGAEGRYLTVSENGKFHPAHAQFGVCPHCQIELKVEASLADISFNIAKGELNTGVLENALREFMSQEKDTCSEEAEGNTEPGKGEAEVSLGAVSSELMCSLFQGSGRAINTVFTKSFRPFTQFEHYTNEELAQLDATLFNRITTAQGSYDVNGDNRGELIFPPGIPNMKLSILTTGDLLDSRYFYVKLGNQQELKDQGWDIRPFGSSQAGGQYEFEAEPLSVNETTWVVTTTEDAPSQVVAEFELVLEHAFYDETVFSEDVDLYKDRTFSDLAIEADGSPAAVSTEPGTNITYTATITNRGHRGATGVKLHALDLLGDGLSFTGASTLDRTLDCQQQVFVGITCHLGDLDDQGSVEVTLEYELAFCRQASLACSADGVVDTINATLSVESDNDDPAPENNSAIVITQVLESPDRAVLSTLYHSNGGPGWISDRKWLGAEPIGDWYGVDTDDSGRVTRLNLSHNNLSGEMPAVLASLANLRELRLHNNNLDGPIPSWLADLTGLQRLYLAGNAFIGCVPEGLADVPDNDLGSLGLDDCGLGTGEFASVSAGSGHTCGVKGDGTVACWGRNSQGRATPPAGEFASVSAGSQHTCGLRRDGTVACWGWNRYSQATPPAGEFASVSAGGLHTCGVRRDGTVACWGENLEGQARPPAGEFASVSAGSVHTCGLRRDGTVACWGENLEGQARPPAGEFASVSAGSVHTCGLRRDGTVACWGENLEGQARPPAGEFASVSGGYLHTCGVQRNGTVACWGDNLEGQARPPAGEFASVSAGWDHTCGVRQDGSVACWGEDSWGQATPPGGPVPAFARNPSQDLDTLSASGNTWPEGIWSDGVTMWVADYQDDKIYAYNMRSKGWDEGKDFNTLIGAGNNHPSGLWSDGTTMWVVDHEDVMVYAYDMATKAHDQAKDFSNLRGAGQTHPEGIWSDGTTVWISEGWHQGAKIYAYNLKTKEREPDNDIDALASAGNLNTHALWSDGTTIWAAEHTGERPENIRLFAYSLATKDRQETWDNDNLIPSGNNGPRGLWSNGNTMWVSDEYGNKLFAYDMSP